MPTQAQVLKAALAWHLDAGADAVQADTPQDMTQFRRAPESAAAAPATPPMAAPRAPAAPAAQPLGTAEARVQSLQQALAAQSLDELRAAIAAFDGLAIRRTATNMVFADGNPQSPVMVIGEAPGADEDLQGKPFVGASGKLLDRILACIGLDRNAEDAAKAVYISNILNWRPPGNRTPSPAEIDVSLPFIERHIALVKPRLLVFAGGVSTKALLGSEDGISRLRGRFQAYTPRTPELHAVLPEPIPALATYHPSYLLRTPSQKKLVWADMLLLEQKMRDMGL